MNRFDNYSWGSLQLPTLEQMSAVPGAKRTQHDAVTNAMAEKMLQIDSHVIHTPEAEQLKQDYNSKMEAAINKINSEGIGSNSMQDFINFNKEYQMLTGPGGKVPAMKNAKESIYKETGEYYKNPNTRKYGPAVAQTIFNAQLDKYAKDYNESGEIVPFQSVQLPEFQEAQDYINKGLTNIGHTLRDFPGETKLTPDIINGKYVIRTDSSSTKTKENVKQLNAALESLRVQARDPNSPIGQSFQLQGLYEPSGAKIKDKDGNLQDVSKFEYMLLKSMDSRIVDEQGGKSSISFTNLGEFETPSELTYGDNEGPYSSRYQSADKELYPSNIEKSVKTVWDAFKSPLDKPKSKGMFNNPDIVITDEDRKKMEDHEAQENLPLNKKDRTALNDALTNDPELRIYFRDMGVPLYQKEDGNFGINNGKLTRADVKRMLAEIEESASMKPPVSKSNNQLVTPMVASKTNSELLPGKADTSHDTATYNAVMGGAPIFTPEGEKLDISGMKVKEIKYLGYISPNSQQFRAKGKGEPFYNAEKIAIVKEDGTSTIAYKPQSTDRQLSQAFRLNQLQSEMVELSRNYPNTKGVRLSDLSQRSKELLTSYGIRDLENTSFSYDHDTKLYTMKIGNREVNPSASVFKDFIKTISN